VRCGLSSKLFAHLFVLVSVFVSDNRTATQQPGWRADWASNESAGPGRAGARPGRAGATLAGKASAVTAAAAAAR